MPNIQMSERESNKKKAIIRFHGLPFEVAAHLYSTRRRQIYGAQSIESSLFHYIHMNFYNSHCKQ